MDTRITRRQVLGGAGIVAAGAAMAGIGLSGMASTAIAAAEFKGWGYKEIDPDKAAAIAYENWYKNFCCYATASGILIPLREAVGGPYNTFPIEAVTWGHGGAVGWGTLCGTLTGTGIATGLIAGKEGEAVLNDVIYYYTTTELPIYQPSNPKATFKNVNKSDSPLCHISVGRWMEKEDVKFFSPQRKDRCARLAADMARKTVELLNAQASGTFKAECGNQAQAFGITSQNNCTDCHGSNIPKVPGT